MKDRHHIHISIDTESIPLLSVHPRSGSTCLYKCSHIETRGRFFVICYQEYSFCSKPHKVTCLLINFLCINENDFHFSHFHLKIIVIGMFTLIKFTMRNPPPLVLYICYSWQAHLSGIGLLPVYFQLLSSILLLFPEVKTHYEFYFNKYLSFSWYRAPLLLVQTPLCPPMPMLRHNLPHHFLRQVHQLWLWLRNTQGRPGWVLCCCSYCLCSLDHVAHNLASVLSCDQHTGFCSMFTRWLVSVTGVQWLRN